MALLETIEEQVVLLHQIPFFLHASSLLILTLVSWMILVAYSTFSLTGA